MRRDSCRSWKTSRLKLALQQRSDMGLQGQVAHLQKQRQQLLDDNDALHAQLVDSLLAITRAHPDNFEHDKVQRRVVGKGEEKDTGEDFYVMNTGNVPVVKKDPVTLCDFVTWDVSTIGHCLQLVRDATSDIARFYTAVGKEQPEQSKGDMMGWRQQRRTLVKKNTSVEFALFASVTLSGQLFHKTWAFCRNQRQFATMLEPVLHALQIEVLHQINDDIVVVRRMQQDLSPDGEKQTPTKYRSIYLLYRMTSPAGLLVVLQSVNPSFTRRCGCANNLWFESFMWFGFSSTAATDSTKAGCRVRFGGTIDGHSEEFARRWQREIFFMLMRWEAHNVAVLTSHVKTHITILQEITDDVLIIDRRTEDQSHNNESGEPLVLRTVYMLFRVDDDGVQTLAMKTLDVPTADRMLHGDEVWWDIFYWIRVSPLDCTAEVSAMQEVTTVTKFGGTNACEDLAASRLKELIFLAIRWETLAVAPFLLKE
ncbi:hypothetical protein P3T76_003930 [Phytophthora citrophthora]|uniref:Uncharacterized protein n=1 Tax=Phytophthora citrophthora TaxID=4793 RepID=A0AAD9LNL4_9STRA|nr:hypothetical protein P3T76_003930 [Phytophthora citrophthora]